MANTKIVLNRQSDLILDNANITAPVGIVVADIAGLESAILSIDTAESAHMSAEVSSRVAGDVSVTSAMSAEISTRIVAETSLQNNIDAEASSRVVGDQAEESRAIAAETSLATDLDAEQSRAESAEASLNAKVENVISNVDPAALDSLTEIVGAFQSADGDLNGAITALGSTATAAVDNEASIRLAADQSLAGDLSSEIADREAAVSLEEAARISGDASVNADLSTEIEARISDVNAEQARAESAEAILTAGLSSEVSRAQSAEALLTDDLASEATYRVAAVSAEASIRYRDDRSLEVSLLEESSSLASLILSEVSRAESADTSLEVALSTSVSNANASIDAAISTEISDRGVAIDNEASIRLSADESLATDLGFNSKGDGVEWNDYLDGFTNGLTLPTGGFITAEDFAIMYGPINSINFGAFRDRYISSLCFNGIDIETTRAESAEASLDAAKLNLAGGTMSGNIDLGGNQITDAAKVSASRVQIDYINAPIGNDIQVDSKFDFQGENSIINLPAPTNNGDAANKLYVDSADQSLATALSSEISDRGVAIDGEASSRVAGDLSLQNQIDFITNNTDAAAIDSLTEIVAAFQSADGDINGAITALSSTATSGLSTEVARAESAEASLDAAKLNLAGGTMSGAIDMGGNNITNANSIIGVTLETDAIAGHTGDILLHSILDAQNTTNIINLPAPINGGDATNKTYVDSADQSLAADLSSTVSTEVAARESADASLFNKIENEIDNRGDAQYSIDNAISTEVAVRESGDASLALDLSSEISARLEAGSSIATDLSTAVSTEESARLSTEASIATELSSEIEALADVDGTTIVLNGDTNQIELKESIAAPASGIRTFLGEVDVETILKVGGVDVMATISSEISRAESAEDSLEIALSTEVSYLIANTDLTSIDSFSEVSDAVSAEISRAESAEASIDSFIGFDEKGAAANDTYSLYLDILAGNQQLVSPNGNVWPIEDISGEFGPANYTNYMSFARYYFANLNSTALFEEVTRAESVELSLATDFTAIYFKKATFTGTIDNVNNQFTLASSVRGGSETVYLNGLLQEAGVDYTVAGDVISFDSAPKTGDKVVIYAVY